MGYFGGMGRKIGYFFEKVEKWGATRLKFRQQYHAFSFSFFPTKITITHVFSFECSLKRLDK